MARPTSEKKEKTVKLRVSEELYSEIERCGSNISETIRELIRDGLGVKKHGKIPKADNVPQNTENRLKAALLLRCTEKAKVFLDSDKIECITVISTEEYEKTGGNVPQNSLDMDEESYRDLKMMCEVSGLSMGRFMGHVRQLFNDGKIYVDGLTVKTRGEYDLRPLLDMCHRVNVDPQDMIDRLVNSLRR